MNSSQFKIVLLVQIVTLFLVGMLFFKQTKTENGKPFSNSGEKASGKFSKAEVQPGNNFVYGKPDAKNELIVFTRYNCGFCRDFYNEAFDSLRINYVNTGRLKIIFMDNVNPSDKQGMLMAKVAEIGKQLNVYDAVQYQLYHGSQPEDSMEVIQRAIKAGINENELKKQLQQPTLTDEIFNDNKEVDRLHLSGTPTFIINGSVVVGFKGYEEFKSRLEELIIP